VMEVVREADRHGLDLIIGKQFVVVGCRHRCPETTPDLFCARYVLIRDTDEANTVLNKTLNAPCMRRRHPTTPDDSIAKRVTHLQDHLDHLTACWKRQEHTLRIASQNSAPQTSGIDDLEIYDAVS
jgi:hypothetical protein